MADVDFVGRMGPELELLLPLLDERARRLVLGAVARAAGDGGIGSVASVTGVSRATVTAGAQELAAGAEPVPGRSQRPGAGRKKLEERDPGLAAALKQLVEASTRGGSGVAAGMDNAVGAGDRGGRLPGGVTGAARTRWRGCCTRTDTACPGNS